MNQLLKWINYLENLDGSDTDSCQKHWHWIDIGRHGDKDLTGKDRLVRYK